MKAVGWVTFKWWWPLTYTKRKLLTIFVTEGDNLKVFMEKAYKQVKNEAAIGKVPTIMYTGEGDYKDVIEQRSLAFAAEELDVLYDGYWRFYKNWIIIIGVILTTIGILIKLI